MRKLNAVMALMAVLSLAACGRGGTGDGGTGAGPGGSSTGATTGSSTGGGTGTTTGTPTGTTTGTTTGTSTGGTTGGGDYPPVDNSPPPEQAESLDPDVLADVPTFDRCDFLDNSYCLFPWPNDYFTTEQPETSNRYGKSTTRRVNLDILSMPRNTGGKPLDPTEWNRNDGFSPGQAILVKVPGLDLAKTGAVGITSLQKFSEPDQAIVVIDADTLKRHLVYAEIDADVTKFAACDSFKPAATIAELAQEASAPEDFANAANDARQQCIEESAGAPPDPTIANGPALIIRPAKNFEEGHRYIVALRRLKDAAGEVIEPSPAFRIYRDNHPTDLPMVQARREHMESLFTRLGLAGVDRDDLYLTWDFTVASQRNLSERMLSIRDKALSELGSAAPQISDVTVVNNATGSVAREVRGVITVPSFMNRPFGNAGSRFYYEPDTSGLNGDGLPDTNPFTATQTFDFICRIPRQAFKGSATPDLATDADAAPARTTLYGHGLLGSKGEGGGPRAFMDVASIIHCATDWIGMATHEGPDGPDTVYYDPPLGDIVNVATILTDMSNFPTLADRVQQGMLNFIWLGRAVLHADGFCALPEFKAGNTCLIDRSELFYDGNSQGGIIGGALLAVSPDIRRGVLGVPGMNYSTLLQRSVDFDLYAGFFYASYRSSLDQQFVLSLIQMLWDRAETNGYIAHLHPDKPYVDTPSKRVLLHPAFGDHQVTVWSADVMARTMGASVHCPALNSGTSAQSAASLLPGAHPAVAEEAALFDAQVNPFGFKHPQRRHPDDIPYFAIPCLSGDYKHDGNAMVVWDSGPVTNADCGNPNGVVTPPINNTPPRPELCYGADPHEHARRAPKGLLQKDRFLKQGGLIENTCGNLPCVSEQAFGFDPSP